MSSFTFAQMFFNICERVQAPLKPERWSDSLATSLAELGTTGTEEASLWFSNLQIKHPWDALAPLTWFIGCGLLNIHVLCISQAPLRAAVGPQDWVLANGNMGIRWWVIPSPLRDWCGCPLPSEEIQKHNIETYQPRLLSHPTEKTWTTELFKIHWVLPERPQTFYCATLWDSINLLIQHGLTILINTLV